MRIRGRVSLASELFVVVICEACRRQLQVRCVAGWDLARVEHDCDARDGFVVQRVEPATDQAVMAV